MGNIFCDSNVVLCFDPHKYIENMVQTYVTLFFFKYKTKQGYQITFVTGDHPELDMLEFLGNKNNQKISTPHWFLTVGHLLGEI